MPRRLFYTHSPLVSPQCVILCTPCHCNDLLSTSEGVGGGEETEDVNREETPTASESSH